MNNEFTNYLEEVKRSALNNKKFHYMMTDRARQDVGYYLRIKSKEKTLEWLNVVEMLLGLFDKKDIPEWYTFDDLESDKQRFNKLFGAA